MEVIYSCWCFYIFWAAASRRPHPEQLYQSDGDGGDVSNIKKKSLATTFVRDAMNTGGSK